MDKYEETFESWNNLANLYQDKFMCLDIYNNSYDIICNSITKPRAKILEVGCGPGNISKYLLTKKPDFDILGIDVAPNMIELAKKNNPTAKYIILDSRKLNEINLKFDGIVCGFILPYLSQTDSNKLISDCANLLNENGLLYLSFVEGDPGKSDFIVGSSGHRSFFYYHNLDEIIAMLERNNFVSTQIHKVMYKRSESENEVHTIITTRR